MVTPGVLVTLRALEAAAGDNEDEDENEDEHDSEGGARGSEVASVTYTRRLSRTTFRGTHGQTYDRHPQVPSTSGSASKARLLRRRPGKRSHKVGPDTWDKIFAT